MPIATSMAGTAARGPAAQRAGRPVSCERRGPGVASPAKTNSKAEALAMRVGWPAVKSRSRNRTRSIPVSHGVINRPSTRNPASATMPAHPRDRKIALVGSGSTVRSISDERAEQEAQRRQRIHRDEAGPGSLEGGDIEGPPDEDGDGHGGDGGAGPEPDQPSGGDAAQLPVGAHESLERLRQRGYGHRAARRGLASPPGTAQSRPGSGRW